GQRAGGNLIVEGDGPERLDRKERQRRLLCLGRCGRLKTDAATLGRARRAGRRNDHGQRERKGDCTTTYCGGGRSHTVIIAFTLRLRRISVARQRASAQGGPS